MLLLKPTGRFSVGIQDISYCSADSASKIAADNHVVGRVFYPAKSSGWLSRPLTWIRDYHYAQGECDSLIRLCIYEQQRRASDGTSSSSRKPSYGMHRKQL